MINTDNNKDDKLESINFIMKIPKKFEFQSFSVIIQLTYKLQEKINLLMNGILYLQDAVQLNTNVNYIGTLQFQQQSPFFEYQKNQFHLFSEQNEILNFEFDTIIDFYSKTNGRKNLLNLTLRYNIFAKCI